MKSSRSTSDENDNDDNDNDQQRRLLWEDYEITIRTYQEQKLLSSPGYFSMSPDERHYEQCRTHPLPRLLPPHNDDIIITPHPILTLPLRINFIRNEYIGCSDALSHSSAVPYLMERINYFWKQAGISFHHVPTPTTNDNDNNTTNDDGALSTELSFDNTRLPPTSQRHIQSFIHSLHRDPNGQMSNKSQRKDVFLNQLLSHFDYLSRAINCYNIYMIDYTGHGSQGCCIDRPHRTILMGERSDKGYDALTKRPWECLGKTMAHELGHALGLGHPKGRRFKDGVRQCQSNKNGRRNLMEGGVDKKGGGGDFLEEWQVSLVREEGRRFLRQR